MKHKPTKVCFAASSGGHLAQLMELKPVMDKYDSFIVTEKTDYEMNFKEIKHYFVHQVNRKEKLFPVYILMCSFKSLWILLKERPDVIVSTGVLAMAPICLLAKIFRKKLIFIESFAKIDSPTVTGKILYKYADTFFVQWESMLKEYPDAKYEGCVY